MISRRNLLAMAGLGMISIKVPAAFASSEGMEPLVWFALDASSVNVDKVDEISTALRFPGIRVSNFLNADSVSDQEFLAQPSVIPSPGLLSDNFPRSQAPEELKVAWKKRFENLGFSTEMLSLMSSVADRGAYPLSVSLYGVIFRYSVFSQLGMSLALHRNWDQRIEAFKKISIRGPAIALGNEDGISGAHLFSSMSLGVNGPELHGRFISGENRITLSSARRTLKIIKRVLQFANKDASKISSTKALERVLSGRSATTFCWTPSAASAKAWDAQDLGFATLSPVSFGSPSKYLAEGSVNSLYLPSEKSAEEIQEFLFWHFSDSRLIHLSSLDLNSFYLLGSKQLHWPGIASQLSNLRSLRIETHPSLVLSLDSQFVKEVLMPNMFSFLEKPTEKNLESTAKSISNA
jgi:hypothetical protein